MEKIPPSPTICLWSSIIRLAKVTLRGWKPIQGEGAFSIEIDHQVEEVARNNLCLSESACFPSRSDAASQRANFSTGLSRTLCSVPFPAWNLPFCDCLLVVSTCIATGIAQLATWHRSCLSCCKDNPHKWCDNFKKTSRGSFKVSGPQTTTTNTHPKLSLTTSQDPTAKVRTIEISNN